MSHTIMAHHKFYNNVQRNRYQPFCLRTATKKNGKSSCGIHYRELKTLRTNNEHFLGFLFLIIRVKILLK